MIALFSAVGLGISLAIVVFVFWKTRPITYRGTLAHFRLHPDAKQVVNVKTYETNTPVEIATQSSGPYVYKHGYQGYAQGQERHNGVPFGWNSNFYFDNVSSLGKPFGDDRVIELDKAEDTVDFFLAAGTGLIATVSCSHSFRSQYVWASVLFTIITGVSTIICFSYGL
jgi:hypothetical protein